MLSNVLWADNKIITQSITQSPLKSNAKQGLFNVPKLGIRKVTKRTDIFKQRILECLADLINTLHYTIAIIPIKTRIDHSMQKQEQIRCVQKHIWQISIN